MTSLQAYTYTCKYGYYIYTRISIYMYVCDTIDFVYTYTAWLQIWIPDAISFNPFVPTVPTFAVRETASLGIMGAPRVPPLNPSETIVF